MSTKKIRLAALEERLKVRDDVFRPSADPMAGFRAAQRLLQGCFGYRANAADPEALPPGGIAQAGGVDHEEV